jgi:zinc/manganese transport system substrate-binding protein
MRKWIKAIGGALTVAFVAAGLYTFFINSTSTDEPTGSASPSPSPTLTRDGDTGVIKVVTSTNVWASVVEILGGDWVEVTPIIQDPLQDPHSYEASARDQLALSEADLVIANGGGYDEFMVQLMAALDGEQAFVTLTDGDHDHSETDTAHANEHIWYDLEEVGHASELIVDAIVELRPEAFDQLTTNFDFFISELDNLEIRREALREKALGIGYVAAEGVANLMLDEAGFENVTPEALADAIEEEREVPPAALKQATDLIEGDVAGLLVVNSQVSDVATEQLRAVAEAAGIPVFEASELIPASDMDYLDWMASILDQLQEAVY